MNQKYDIGKNVIIDGQAGVIDDYDDEDNSYRVSFNETDFSWCSEEDIN